MSYYLIMFGVAILSFLLAIYNEKKFQKKIEELSNIEEEIKEISIKLERLNNRKKGVKETNKIIFQSPYELMGYDSIIKDCYIHPIVSKRWENLISNSFKYGQEKGLRCTHKRQQNICSKKRNNEAKKYFSVINPSNELMVS